MRMQLHSFRNARLHNSRAALRDSRSELRNAHAILCSSPSTARDNLPVPRNLASDGQIPHCERNLRLVPHTFVKRIHAHGPFPVRMQLAEGVPNSSFSPTVPSPWQTRLRNFRERRIRAQIQYPPPHSRTVRAARSCAYQTASGAEARSNNERFAQAARFDMPSPAAETAFAQPSARRLPR